MERVVAECAAAEVSPQVEIFQLDAGRSFEISSEKGEVNIAARGQPIEQRRDAGHDAFAGARLIDLTRKVSEIERPKAGEVDGVWRQAVRGRRGVQDAGIGPAGH